VAEVQVTREATMESIPRPLMLDLRDEIPEVAAVESVS
jgi:hypothetical protein